MWSPWWKNGKAWRALRKHFAAPHMHTYRTQVKDLVIRTTLQILGPLRETVFLARTVNFAKLRAGSLRRLNRPGGSPQAAASYR